MKDCMENLKLAYSGPALTGGEIDIALLGRSLIAFGGLMQSANKVLNNDRARVNVKIKAFQEGSFEVDLHTAQSILQATANFFAQSEIVGLEKIIQYLFEGTLSVVGVIALFKGNVAKFFMLESGDFRVETTDGDELVVPAPVVHLYQNIEIRQSLLATISPLEQDGITEIAVKRGNVTYPLADSQTLKYFSISSEDEVLTTNEGEIVLSIEVISFKDGNKSKFSDGSRSFHALLLDKSFMNKIDSNEISFSKGDHLRVVLRTTQYRTLSGLKTDFEIVQVIEHFRAMQQMKLG